MTSSQSTLSISSPLQSTSSMSGGFSSTPPAAASIIAYDLKQAAFIGSRPPLSVVQSLRGKKIFLTGGTGFVGKVIIEKLLRSCPSIESIFVLIRPRKGSSIEARLKSEVVDSEIFARLKSEIGVPAFQTLTQNKLLAMKGEMTQDVCGLSPIDLRVLQTEVDVVIHCAAIVDFNERIDRAVELNVFGSLRLLSLMQVSTRIAAFVHVSTCYVNCNRRGWIDERLYDLGFNAREMLERIRQLQQSDLEQIMGTGLLGDWPNTYTFTKAITEHLLVEERGRIPLAIVRPSIVGGSSQEPVPGWVDVISAAGAVYLSAGLGVLKFLPGSAEHIADLVPVDYVVNAILATIPAIANEDRFVIVHAATSSEKPMHWGVACDQVVKYFQRHPPDKRLGPPTFNIIESPQWYQIQFFLQYSVPSALLNSISTAPFAPKSYRLKAAQFERLVFRARVIVEAFRHFVENEWQYNNRNTRAIGASLCDEERALFPLDLTNFHWDTYNIHFAHGLLRFVLKAELNPIPIADERVININQIAWKPRTGNEPSFLSRLLKPLAPQLSHAHELWAERPRYPKARPLASMIECIVRSGVVQAAIAAENKRLAGLKPKRRTATAVAPTTTSPFSAGEARARSIMSKMFSEVDESVMAGVGYAFQNLWQRMYDAINVEAIGLLKARAAAAKGPLIFIPTHRSYVDFLVVSYVCYQCALPLPHIAAGEDFLGILLVRWLFRRSGAFFIRRSLDASGDPLYGAIFSAYLQQLLSDGQSIEFFIEGTRSRSGKLLHPKQGMLSILSEAVLEGKIKDAFIVPISINYEQTMEGELYSSELLGEAKIRESLKSLVTSASVLNAQFGDISVIFGEPISVAESARQHRATPLPHEAIARARAQTQLEETAVSSHSGLAGEVAAIAGAASQQQKQQQLLSVSERRYFHYLLSYRIVHCLTVNSSVMPTSMVATFMLMYRQGISFKQLVSSVDWLRRELDERCARTHGLQGEDRQVLVERALQHLKGLVVQRRSGVYEPAIAARSEYRNMLVLGHYRNKLVHHFFREGLWACALYSFGDGAIDCGVDKRLLTPVVRFLFALLHREFICKSNPDEEEDLEQTLVCMIGRGCLAQRQSSQGVTLIEVAENGEALFSFLCALMWPFLDSYYASALTLFTVQPEQVIEESALLHRTQWLATTLYHESMLSFYESCSMDTLSNAYHVLEQWRVIEKRKGNKSVGVLESNDTNGDELSGGENSVGVTGSPLNIRLLGEFTTEAGLQALVARIDRVRKPPPVRKTVSRRSLIADIPILARTTPGHSKL